MQEFEQLKQSILVLISQLENAVDSTAFWLQVGIISLVFVVSHWLIAPHVKKLLHKPQSAKIHLNSFNVLLSNIAQYANIIIWLMLQWSAIAIYNALDKTHQLLTPVASLLTAWLLLKIASKLIANPVASRSLFVIVWAAAILNILDLLQPTINFLDSLAFKAGDIRITPLLVFKVIFGLWLSLWLAKVISSFLEKRLETTDNVSPAMRVLSVKLVNVGLVTAAFIITISAVGIDLTAFAIFGGALGVGLGFGLQKIFSNLVSGIILLMDRSIKPGDVISVGSTFGWINQLSARYVSVITRDGIEHLIPNETLVTDRVENWSHSDSLIRIKVEIGISYKSDVRLAMKLCIEAANEVSRIVKPDETRCLMASFGDNSVNLELRAWIEDPANGRANITSDILLGVWDRFHQHGIEIPFPQRDLHLSSIDKTLLQKFDPKSND